MVGNAEMIRFMYIKMHYTERNLSRSSMTRRSEVSSHSYSPLVHQFQNHSDKTKIGRKELTQVPRPFLFPDWQIVQYEETSNLDDWQTL